MRAEPVTDDRCRLGEGPLWDADRRRLWWVDIVGRRIHGLDGTRRIEPIEAPAEPGTLVLDTEGALLAALPDGCRRVEGWERLAPVEADDPRTRANDGKIDPEGRWVQGFMGFEAESGIGSLHRIDPDGTVERLLGGMTIPNGLDWPGDGTMLHVDTPTGEIRVWDHPDVATARTLTTIDPTLGAPDGLTLDAEGGIWVALWGGRAVHRYTPDGRLDQVVEIPAENPTSVAFGGDDRSTLFVTSAGLDSDPGDDPLGGRVFACRPGVAGRLPNRFGQPT